jgi:hypothetical protein
VFIRVHWWLRFRTKPVLSLAGTKWALRRLGFLLFKTFPLSPRNLAAGFGQYTFEQAP